METYIPRFLTLPNQTCFLLGPRGTGKSTYLKHQLPGAMWIDLLKPDSFRQFQTHPERLEELILGNPSQKDIIIDEVQRVPELLPLVHRILEMKKGHRFVLTGSSARKLKASDVDLLGGRAVRKSMHPFMMAELQQLPSIEEILQLGTLPIVYQSTDKTATLDAYISLYMQQEVFHESLVRNTGDFARFLEAVSFSHGAVLNISNIARDCGVGRKTVEGFIHILEDILLAYRLEVFTKKASRVMSAHPKFYFFDAGVFQTLRPKGVLDRPEEIHGAALEGLVAQHLRAWTDYSSQRDQLFFWRSQRGVEVDFILYGPNGFFAFEVKNSARIRPQDLTGLAEFEKDYPEARLVFLYRGEERLLRNNILFIPVNRFLKRLRPMDSIEDVLNEA